VKLQEEQANLFKQDIEELRSRVAELEEERDQLEQQLEEQEQQEEQKPRDEEDTIEQPATDSASPAPPAPPSAPVAPPPPPATPPTAPAPPPSAPAPPAGGASLASALAAGTKLKATPTQEPKKVDNRTNLMTDIKGGVQLKKVVSLCECFTLDVFETAWLIETLLLG